MTNRDPMAEDNGLDKLITPKMAEAYLIEECGRPWNAEQGAAMPELIEEYRQMLIKRVNAYTTNKIKVAEEYGRLHEIIEAFQNGAVKANYYSERHAEITDRIDKALNHRKEGNKL